MNNNNINTIIKIEEHHQQSDLRYKHPNGKQSFSYLSNLSNCNLSKQHKTSFSKYSAMSICMDSNKNDMFNSNLFKVRDNLSLEEIVVQDHAVINDACSLNNCLEKQLSSYSMSELDNIKKKTLKNLKDAKKRFDTFRQMKLFFNTVAQNRTRRRKRMRQFERLIAKNGEANIDRVNIEKRSLKYIYDLFTTFIDMKWLFIMMIFVLSFLISWLFFALLWFFLGAYDCVANLGTENSFLESFLFSIETQQTIGYGARYITAKCKFGVAVLMVQCGFSVILQSLMGGIIFAKLSRPIKRTETLKFSNIAVIAKRDGVYTFMCRVGDMRKSHITNAFATMYLVKTRTTMEGECIPGNVQELKVGHTKHSSDKVIFMPTIVEHVIDLNSPLLDLIVPSSSNLESPSFKRLDFEIVVIFEGIESSGQTTQARTSFLPNEILFDHVFEPLMIMPTSSHASKRARIDFCKFDLTRNIKYLNETSLSSVSVTAQSTDSNAEENYENDVGECDEVEESSLMLNDCTNEHKIYTENSKAMLMQKYSSPINNKKATTVSCTNSANTNVSFFIEKLNESFNFGQNKRNLKCNKHKNNKAKRIKLKKNLESTKNL